MRFSDGHEILAALGVDIDRTPVRSAVLNFDAGSLPELTLICYLHDTEGRFKIEGGEVITEVKKYRLVPVEEEA